MNFTDLDLPEALLFALEESGYVQPTPIQGQAIPLALAGRDLMLSAQTGSGKTAAFLLPILTKLIRSERDKQKRVKALILAPTRELAQQIQSQVRKYGHKLRWLFSAALVGGSDYRGQIIALRRGVQIVIATPGRLLDHLNAGRLDLSAVDTLVLDEADRMLDMGFADDLQAIMERLPAERQTVMSSATWAGAVGRLAQRYTRDAEQITIEPEVKHIEERVYFSDHLDHKHQLLEHLLQEEMGQAIIFTSTKSGAENVCDRLRDNGHRARFIHGDLHQSKRNRIVEDLRRGRCDILVATDVVARGIDIPSISHVINFDLPRQLEDYVHRIGRSGRAGRSGVALSLVSLEDRQVLRRLIRYLGRELASYEIPGLEPKVKPKAKAKPKKKFRGAPEKGYGKGRGGDKKRNGERNFNGGRSFGRSDESFNGGFGGRRFAQDGERSFGKKRFDREGERGWGRKRFEQFERFESPSEGNRRRFNEARGEGQNPRFNERADGNRRRSDSDKPVKKVKEKSFFRGER